MAAGPAHAGRGDPRLGPGGAGCRRRPLCPRCRRFRAPPGRVIGRRTGRRATAPAGPPRPPSEPPRPPSEPPRVPQRTDVRPARQTAPVPDSLDAELATLTDEGPVPAESTLPAAAPTEGRQRPALDLLIWDAPNIDMTLSTVIGARPTAASRPRFDAIAAWFVEGAGDPAAPG